MSKNPIEQIKRTARTSQSTSGKETTAMLKKNAAALLEAASVKGLSELLDSLSAVLNVSWHPSWPPSRP